MPFRWRVGWIGLETRYTGQLIPLNIYLCPVCAGKLCAALVVYFKERTRLGLRGGRRYKNAKRPIRFMGAWRCARCEMQLKDFKMGDSPYCEECR